MQLAPPSRQRGLRRDLAVVAAVAAGVAIVVAVVVWLFVPAAAQPGFLRGAAFGGPAAPMDVPIDRVIAREADGRQSLTSVTLRMKPDTTPDQLRTIAARTPTPVRDDAPPPRDANPPAGSAEALVRDKIGEAVSGLTYQATAGEQGKDRLRQAIRDSVNSALPGAPVEQVYIREYWVQ